MADYLVSVLPSLDLAPNVERELDQDYHSSPNKLGHHFAPLKTKTRHVTNQIELRVGPTTGRKHSRNQPAIIFRACLFTGFVSVSGVSFSTTPLV